MHNPTSMLSHTGIFGSVLSIFIVVDSGFGYLYGSLEQVQVELFEKQICGGAKPNLLQYSMVLFCCTEIQGKLMLISCTLFAHSCSLLDENVYSIVLFILNKCNDLEDSRK